MQAPHTGHTVKGKNVPGDAHCGLTDWKRYFSGPRAKGLVGHGQELLPSDIPVSPEPPGRPSVWALCTARNRIGTFPQGEKWCSQFLKSP